MTPLQWVLLCVLFTLYLLFGGSVFMYFEQHREIEKKEEISVLRKDIKEILILLDRDFYHKDTTNEMIHALTSAKIGILHRISAVCDVGDLYTANPDEHEEANETSTTTASPLLAEEEKEDDKLKWNFYNSVFFAFTVITTIGYGHLSPSTKWSKCFIMIYALIGIPINSILLNGLGDYFSSRLVNVHQKAKGKPKNKFAAIFEILFYLIPGLIVFIICPAVVFVFIESWSFLDSVYYAFVSLTTIGFGDYVAGMGNGHTVWMWIYKSFIIIWITFGLGYLIMILGFISKGLTHKKVRVVIEKRLNTIRITKDKLSRDIEYMRRVVNELYLMKIKPVYDSDDSDNDDKLKGQRSSSLGMLERRYSSYPQLPVTAAKLSNERKLGNGDVRFSIGEEEISNLPKKIGRRFSDSDIENIDRDKTFESAIRQQVTVDELLVSVVHALAGNMNEVMEAVEELNEYEQEVIEESEGIIHQGPSRSRAASLVSDEPVHPRHLESHPHHGHSRDHDDLPPWDLGALSESDEEELFGEDDTDALKQVVVHGGSKPSSSTILDKVSGAIRKISAGSKTSETSSRKVSRNESHSRRRMSRNDSTEKRLSHSAYPGHGNTKQYLNPQAYAHERKSSTAQRKISEESRVSNMSAFSARSRLSDITGTPCGYGSNASSRKISPANLHDPENPDGERRSKMTLESTTLAEFLQALDNVHSKLRSTKTSVASMSGESTQFDDPFHSHLPIVRRSARRRISEIEGAENAFPRNGRKRKQGIIHPTFAYLNTSFVPDDKDNTYPKKNPKDPSNHDEYRRGNH